MSRCGSSARPSGPVRALWLAANLGLALSSACASKAPAIDVPNSAVAKAKPIKASTVAVATHPMPRYTTLTGTLVADRESDVAADVSGKVLSVLIDRGTPVKVGSVLAVLDKRSAAIKAKEAAANVEQARTQAELARLECERADGLLESGALGKAEFDRIKSQCQTSRQSFDAAQARNEAALQSVTDAVIKAPFTGIVSEKFVHVGEYVQPQTRVVHLVATDPLRLQLNVPESALGDIRQDMEVQLQVSAHPKQWFGGKIKYISASLRERTRDLLVEAVVPNPELKLRPGMFAVARLVLPKADAPVVPQASLRVDGEFARLFVDRAGTLEERIVELGAQDGELVEVRKGVSKGEAVISPFSMEAKDGARLAR
jgi:membrane fusion protein (multidrug efflux system)